MVLIRTKLMRVRYSDLFGSSLIGELPSGKLLPEHGSKMAAQISSDKENCKKASSDGGGGDVGFCFQTAQHTHLSQNRKSNNHFKSAMKANT